jgi:large subunit ribosomal protein L35
MPKMKTHRAASKRLRLTGTGKVARRKAFHSHILEKKASKRKRRLNRTTLVSKADTKRVRTMLGGK